MKLPSSRTIYLWGFALICLQLSFMIYLQIYQGITPCPLCILQRCALAILGLLCFFGAALHFKKCGQIILGLLTLLIASAGALLAGRQVWLQSGPPDQAQNCGASLSYLIHALPVDQFIQHIFQSGTECAEVSWQFLHLSLASWSLIWFVLVSLSAIFLILRRT